MTEQTGSYLSFDSFKVNKKTLLVEFFSKLKIIYISISFAYKDITWYEYHEINHLTCVSMNSANPIIYNPSRDQLLP